MKKVRYNEAAITQLLQGTTSLKNIFAARTQPITITHWRR